MDEDMFSVKAVNPYRNTLESEKATEEESNTDYEPLTTKNAVKFLLEGSLKYKVCRYCLNVASPLSELDEIFEVARKGAIYKVTLRVMIASVHPFKIAEDPNFPDKICARCVESAISSYMFAQQCERAGRALRNCFDDIHTKFEKLDPLDPPKKRGRQKLHPNPNVLYTEHNEVIDYAEPIIHIINIGSSNMEDDKEISPLECPKCWQVLPDMESLLNHQSLHPNSMWYSCRLCGQSFVTYRIYKRHIRDVHKDWQIVRERSKVNTSFKCNECGMTSTTFGEHLQHIEKHKFKKTFEHLLDRSMHRLCAVCLEKKPCMTHMNETIQLNGGYPGINNEQAIYNIVSSTFPEPKSYKYQEMLIPTRASIMTITKRMDIWQMKNGRSKDIFKDMFQFCNPTILSTMNTEFETLYIFILSNPYKLTDTLLDDAAISPNLAYPTERNIDDIRDSTFNLLKRHGDVKEVDDPISNDTVDNCENRQESSNIYTETVVDANVENPAGLCKTCWVFNKASCNQCINNQSNKIECNHTIMEEHGKVNSEEKCKYCWLFKAVGKCDYCKKYLKDFQNNDFTTFTNTIEVLTQGQNDAKISEKTEVGNEINTESTFHHEIKKDTRKRKLSSDLTVTQKCKWKCRICLTNNDKNRQTCFCCDFDDNVMDNKVKFNFGENKIFFEYNVQNTTGVQKVTNINNGITNTIQESHSNLMPKEAPTILQKYNPYSISADIVPMDVEIINLSNLQNNSNNNNSNNLNQVTIDESMEVTYEDVAKPLDSQICLPTNMSSVNNNIISLPSVNTVNISQLTPQNMPFQFTIGSSTSTKSPKQRNLRDLKQRIMGRK